MTDTRWLENQLRIRQSIEAYFDACNRRDSDTVMSLWSEQCRWSVPDIPGLENIVGKDAIRQNFEGAQQLFSVVFVVGMVGDIQIEGDTATARVYTTEVLEDHDGNVRNAVGIYEDQLRNESGHWRFTERVWRKTHQQ